MRTVLGRRGRVPAQDLRLPGGRRGRQPQHDPRSVPATPRGRSTSKYRKIACIVLKVMHVIQHIEARDLLFQHRGDEAEIGQMVAERVQGGHRRGAAKGLPIVEYADSIKTRESIITKLIAKKDSTAAAIYDRTRFRVIVKERDGHHPHALLPHPAADSLQLRRADARPRTRWCASRTWCARTRTSSSYARQLHLDVDYEEREMARRGKGNTFSGSTYRVLNFVADVPVRLDAFLPPPETDDRERKGRITLGHLRVPDRRSEDRRRERARGELPRALQGAPARGGAQAPVARPGGARRSSRASSTRRPRRRRPRFLMCTRRESNPYGPLKGPRILSPLRLPLPPLVQRSRERL